MFKNVKAYFEGKTLVQLLGFWGVLLVDFFSVYHFFALQGPSWILKLLPTIFVFVKVWHWQQFWLPNIRVGKRILHFIAWLVLSVLSVYSFVTLGMSITEVEKKTVSVTKIQIEETVDKSTLAIVEGLITERAELVTSKTNLLRKRDRVSVSQEGGVELRDGIQKDVDKVDDRIREIDQSLNSQKETTETNKQKEAQSEEKPWYYVEPIGAEALIGQTVPSKWIKAIMRLVFLLTSLAMEFTLALTSLPKQIAVKKEIEVIDQVSKAVPQEEDDPAKNGELLEQYAQRIEKDPPYVAPPVVIPEPVVVEQDIPIVKNVVTLGKPNVDRLCEFIDLIYPEDAKRLLSVYVLDEQGKFPVEEGKACKRYLASLRFKKLPLIESSRGGTWANVKREDMKKLVRLFDQTEQVEETPEDETDI